MNQWLLAKSFIFVLRKFNDAQEMGLHLDRVLDKKFGKRSEQIQDEIIEIMQKIIKQLRSDRKGGGKK